MSTFNYYWPVYKNLEEEALELTKYIQFTDDQLNVYSMHIADLLVRSAVEIEALSKELYWENGGTKQFDNNGKERDLFFDTDCIAHLDDIWSICSKKVIVSSTKFYFEKEENRILIPLRKARKRSGVKWNKAYQAVKHDRKNSLKHGNIINLINALGALYILNIYYMNKQIDLGVSNNPGQSFDSRFGSDIFAVTYSDATINVQMGGSRTDEALSEELKKELSESIYVLKYTAKSWEGINDAIDSDNERLRKILAESSEFKKYIEEHPEEISKETHLISLVCKVLGSEFIHTHNSFGSFGRAFMNASKEAVVYRNQPVYG